MDISRIFKGKVVGVDTSIFIYYIEENPKYADFLKEVFLKNSQGDFRIITSVITLLEVLVLPYKNARFDLIKEYKAIFHESPEIDLVDLNPEISETSAILRAKYGVRTPDAIEIGTAICEGADYFLTNDKRLESITEIPIFILEKIM